MLHPSSPFNIEASHIESQEARQGGENQPASRPVHSTQSTPCIVRSSTQVSNRLASKRAEKKTQILVPVHSFVSQDQIAEAPPKTKKGPVRIRNFSFFSFVVRDPGGTSSQRKRKKDTHTHKIATKSSFPVYFLAEPRKFSEEKEGMLF